MFNYKDYKVFLACGNTAMRKSINGLCEIVQHNFELDPSEKIIFGFCNRQHNRIKLLVWEDNGFWIHFKRLEKGSIIWPEVSDDELTMSITLDDFQNLIKAPGVKQKIKRQEVWKIP
ncbi:MAG: IS66 family insertion sequence element accessory protein TnpB [Cellulosilyticaceae bacterium]